MSNLIGGSLPDLLKIEKTKYLEAAQESGGTAEGFRSRIRNEYETNPEKFNALVFQALMEATTKTWQAPPRRHGPDLFSINGFEVPDTITRPAGHDNEDDFEKVSCRFATIDDLYADATLKMRKAAQSSAAAERAMQAADYARRKSGGNTQTFLRDIAD